MHSLNVLSDTMGTSITKIMEPHKEVLQDMIPPKKHLLRYQPANAQIGLMEGNTFCTTLEPRLFTIDLNTVEHKVFFTEVGVIAMNLCTSYYISDMQEVMYLQAIIFCICSFYSSPVYVKQKMLSSSSYRATSLSATWFL